MDPCFFLFFIPHGTQEKYNFNPHCAQSDIIGNVFNYIRSFDMFNQADVTFITKKIVL